MHETIRFRGEILALLDSRLGAQGFKRRKAEFAWRRRVSNELTHGLHFNFETSERERYVRVNPSVGVRHESIERALSDSSGVPRSASRDRVNFAKLLTRLAGQRYEAGLADGPEPLAERLWADWCAVGLPALEEMSDLNQVIASLESTEPADWCCFSRSDRARLLPLALRAAGRSEEALARLSHLREDLHGRDQLVPPFEHFERWFRAAAS